MNLFNIDYDCDTTSSGVRKACKDCTCGLAQTLEHEEHTKDQQNIKSSCGNVCFEKFEVLKIIRLDFFTSRIKS